MDTEEIEHSMPPSDQIINKPILPANAFSVMVDELISLPYTIGNEEELKHKVFNYLNNHNVTLQEIFNWIVNNQNYSNAIVIYGEFNEYGIGTSIDKQKAFELYQKAADLKNKAFELYQKAADLGNANGICNLGVCYQNGIGTSVDKQKAFELYRKAAILGNCVAQYNLANTYEEDENIIEAIYWMLLEPTRDAS
ncbi:hypothetical protein C1645_820323 [Glomus cerebriforme]|uniref:Uncharacterized protein n=1 Tax=Glomus cerebriforme TaxID=658196 RepID=A0A397T5W4_9GLOM|nr:hypothetical protein C1645_820323 [Glomus cerebriforme]